MSKKIAFKTLGCRLNLYETDSVVTDFVNAGYEVVDFNEKADAYIVNTCTVTNQSDHKSRQSISQAYRKNENAVLVVTGCMANNHKEKLDNDSTITYMIDNERKSSIYPLLESHFNGEVITPEELVQNRFGFGLANKGFHTRSLIKIQDGCDNFCTFCIVPHVRGRAISRSFEEIESNIQQVLESGAKEIVLTGVNIGRYEFNGLNFEALIEKIIDIPGDFRIRISSIEPEGFGDKLFGLLTHPKMTPHMHMCIQSGSDKILMKMRRQYSVDEFKQMVRKIRMQIPGFNFTTDMMVGFPGETDNDFKESINVIKEIGFSHIHTFKYSIRKGTRAERMLEQVPGRIKSERSAIIRELAENEKRKYRKSLIGKTQNVLIEKIDDNGYAIGYGEHYVPIKFSADENTELNNFKKVRIIGIENKNDPTIFANPIN